MTKHVFESDFYPGQRVFIGEDDALVGIVTGILWHLSDPTVQVCWTNNGNVSTQWLHPCMLRDAQGQI